VLYIYLLYDRRTPPPLRRPDPLDWRSSPPGIAEMLIAYRKAFQVDQVDVLGEQPVERLPMDPDEFVVATCFQVLKKRGISFDGAKDEISYSLDRLGDRTIGTCRIHVRSPQPLPGGRAAPPHGASRVILRTPGTNRRALITALYKLREAYDVASMDSAGYGALVDNTPSTIFDDVDLRWAESIKRQLESTGATVEVEERQAPNRSRLNRWISGDR